MRDLYSPLATPVDSLAVATRNATANGTSTDLQAAPLCEGLNVLVVVGTITDGTHVIKLQESSDNAAWADVAAADQKGAFGANLASNTHVKVSYIGGKRYVRAVTTVTPGATGGVYGVIFQRGFGRHMPLA